MRFLICFVWALAYIYLSELFPTVVRSLALGIISAGGTIGKIYLIITLHIGSTASPFVVSFSKNLGLNPLIILGLIGVIGTISTFPLKETYGKQLEDEIDEEKV